MDDFSLLILYSWVYREHFIIAERTDNEFKKHLLLSPQMLQKLQWPDGSFILIGLRVSIAGKGMGQFLGLQMK